MYREELSASKTSLCMLPSRDMACYLPLGCPIRGDSRWIIDASQTFIRRAVSSWLSHICDPGTHSRCALHMMGKTSVTSIQPSFFWPLRLMAMSSSSWCHREALHSDSISIFQHFNPHTFNYYVLMTAWYPKKGSGLIRYAPRAEGQWPSLLRHGRSI